MTSFREPQPERKSGAVLAAPLVAGLVAGLGSLQSAAQPTSGTAAAATAAAVSTEEVEATGAAGAQTSGSQENSGSDQFHRQMGSEYCGPSTGGSLKQQDSPASLGSQQRCLSFTFGALSPLGSPARPPGFLQAQHQQFPSSPSQLPQQPGFQPAQTPMASPATSPQKPRGLPSPRSVRLTGSVRLVGDTIIPLPVGVGGRLIEALEAAVPPQAAVVPLNVEEQQRRRRSPPGAELLVGSLEAQDLGTSFTREPSFDDILLQQHAKQQQEQQQQQQQHEQFQQQQALPAALTAAAVQVIPALHKNSTTEVMHGAAAPGADTAAATATKTMTGPPAAPGACAGRMAASPPASGPTTPPEAGLLLTPRKRARKGPATRSAYDDEMDPASKTQRIA